MKNTKFSDKELALLFGLSFDNNIKNIKKYTFTKDNVLFKGKKIGNIKLNVESNSLNINFQPNEYAENISPSLNLEGDITYGRKKTKKNK